MPEYVVEQGVPFTRTRNPDPFWLRMAPGDSVAVPAERLRSAYMQVKRYEYARRDEAGGGPRFARNTYPDGNGRIWRVR